MALEIHDIGQKESGKIFHRKPSPSAHNGVLVGVSQSIYNTVSVANKQVRFLHAAFDVSGDRFVTGDHMGNIHMFDLSKNRFTLLQRTGSMPTSLSFSLRRRNEYLVAMSDYSLKCFDSDSKELVAWLKGHRAPIHTISIHASGRYAITSSNDVAQLWDLDTFKRKRKLNIKENIGIVKVFFVPLSNTILTCFKGDSIFAWEADTLNCKYQLPVPPGDSIGYKAFAVTRDGRTLVAGGKSNFLHMWSLETQSIQRIIEMPKKVQQVKMMEFLPDNFDGGSSQVLGVLCQDGIVRFVNIISYKQMFDIGSVDDRINNMVISPVGRHIIALMDSGQLNIYDVASLTLEWNKPPPPLVKVVSSTKMSEKASERSSMVRRRSPGTANNRLSTSRSPKKTVAESDSTTLPEGLDEDRLFAILRGYGEYPAKYRMFIWRSVLQLPENHTAYAALVDKGTHPAYANIHQDYPIKSTKLLRILQRTLSAFAHWSPLFGETKFLPLLAFPFVKLFQHNQLICFEVIATILDSVPTFSAVGFVQAKNTVRLFTVLTSLFANWCQNWFEYFPNPPISVLSMVENIIGYHDRTLLQHFINCEVTAQTYAWPLLETLFSEVFTREEWLKLFDNIFSNPPAFMLMVVVAYCVTSRGPLLQCGRIEDFEYFFHHRNAVSVDQVISEAYCLLANTPESVNPDKQPAQFVPLSQGQYPVFNKYPKFIVDYQVKERERIRQEEIEYLTQRTAALELQKDTQQRQTEEENWYRQQELLLEAEKKRRGIIQEEEEKLAEQRKRLGALTRELKMKELQLLNAARKRFMHHQQRLREAELTRLDDEIERKARLRDLETQASIEEAFIRNVELQIQKKLLEQELQRGCEETTFKTRADYEARRKQSELIEDASRLHIQQEQAKEMALHAGLQGILARAELVDSDAQHQSRLDSLHQLSEEDRQDRDSQLNELEHENRRLEDEVNSLLTENTDAKLQTSRGSLRTSKVRRTLSEQLRAENQERNSSQSVNDGIQERLSTSYNQLDVNNERHRNSSNYSNYLNDSPSAPSSTQLSLDRGRESLDREEQSLMSEIRRLRFKLAESSKNNRPPT